MTTKTTSIVESKLPEEISQPKQEGRKLQKFFETEKAKTGTRTKTKGKLFKLQSELEEKKAVTQTQRATSIEKISDHEYEKVKTFLKENYDKYELDIKIQIGRYRSPPPREAMPYQYRSYNQAMFALGEAFGAVLAIKIAEANREGKSPEQKQKIAKDLKDKYLSTLKKIAAKNKPDKFIQIEDILSGESYSQEMIMLLGTPKGTFMKGLSETSKKLRRTYLKLEGLRKKAPTAETTKEIKKLEARLAKLERKGLKQKLVGWAQMSNIISARKKIEQKEANGNALNFLEETYNRLVQMISGGKMNPKEAMEFWGTLKKEASVKTLLESSNLTEEEEELLDKIEEIAEMTGSDSESEQQWREKIKGLFKEKLEKIGRRELKSLANPLGHGGGELEIFDWFLWVAEKAIFASIALNALFSGQESFKALVKNPMLWGAGAGVFLIMKRFKPDLFEQPSDIEKTEIESFKERIGDLKETNKPLARWLAKIPDDALSNDKEGGLGKLITDTVNAGKTEIASADLPSDILEDIGLGEKDAIKSGSMNARLFLKYLERAKQLGDISFEEILS